MSALCRQSTNLLIRATHSEIITQEYPQWVPSSWTRVRISHSSRQAGTSSTMCKPFKHRMTSSNLCSSVAYPPLIGNSRTTGMRTRASQVRYQVMHHILEFSIQRSPGASVMKNESEAGGRPHQMHQSGYEKLGANSPLLRVGTTITTSTNISTT